MAEQEQHEGQHNVLPLDLSSWSAGPTQQSLPTTLPRYLPPFDGCDGSQPYSSHYHSLPPGSRSTSQQSSGGPETSRNPEESAEEFSASKHAYLSQEEPFILNARLRQESWKVIEEAHKNNFGSFPYESPNLLQMKIYRLKEKHPGVKAAMEKNDAVTKLGRAVKRRKRQAAGSSRADDDAAVATNGEEVVQELSLEEAVRAAQTVLCFLGRPDHDGLVPPEDCMALIRILSQLNQLNRLN